MNKNQTFTITTQSTCIRLDRQKHPHKGPKNLVVFLHCLVSTLFFAAGMIPKNTAITTLLQLLALPSGLLKKGLGHEMNIFLMACKLSVLSVHTEMV
jgi:hypothetical protein